MSRFDEDREELIRLIYSILDYARLGYSISTYNSCNDCERKFCEFKPTWNGRVRWNCPMWVGKGGESDGS